MSPVPEAEPTARRGSRPSTLRATVSQLSTPRQARRYDEGTAEHSSQRPDEGQEEEEEEEEEHEQEEEEEEEEEEEGKKGRKRRLWTDEETQALVAGMDKYAELRNKWCTIISSHTAAHTPAHARMHTYHTRAAFSPLSLLCLVRR